jgi:hypothetical protein
VIPRFLVQYRLPIGMVAAFGAAFLVASGEKPPAAAPAPALEGLLGAPSAGAPPAEPGREPPTTTPARATAYEVATVADGGTIRGRVRFRTRPTVPMVPVSKCREACKHDEHPSERIVFDEETLGVANCLVSIRNVSKGKDWSGEMAKKDRLTDIDQRRCVYVPHVLLVRAKTQLAVRNSDPAEHNIHGYRNSALQNQFNLMSSSGSYIKNSEEAFLEKAATYIVKCDIHPWMNAYVFAVDHPYHVVTGKDGAFELTDVPPGTWEVTCWHEGMGLQPIWKDGQISGYDYGKDVVLTQTVTVPPRGTATADFTLDPPAAK